MGSGWGLGGCEPRIEGIVIFKEKKPEWGCGSGSGGCEPRIEGIVRLKKTRRGRGLCEPRVEGIVQLKKKKKTGAVAGSGCEPSIEVIVQFKKKNKKRTGGPGGGGRVRGPGVGRCQPSTLSG